jgi:hypothetical protein
MVRVGSHHLKLYSECWTGLKGVGENRVVLTNGDGLSSALVV